MTYQEYLDSRESNKKRIIEYMEAGVIFLDIDTVFIDAKDLSTCTVSSTTARLLYVAVSRAKSHVIFYGDLKNKYGKFV